MRPPTACHHRLLQQPSRLPVPAPPVTAQHQPDSRGVVALATHRHAGGRTGTLPPPLTETVQVSQWATTALLRPAAAAAAAAATVDRLRRSSAQLGEVFQELSGSDELVAADHHLPVLDGVRYLATQGQVSQRVTDSAVCHRVTESHRFHSLSQSHRESHRVTERQRHGSPSPSP